MFNEKDVRALAYEKSIEVDRVYSALEDALATAAKKYYKTREPMETVIDRASGRPEFFVVKTVVEGKEQIEDPNEKLS